MRDKSPVTPIIQADRGDSRFTEGRDVGEEMEEGENIAAMDWEDFEHLIRELFESEGRVRERNNGSWRREAF